MDDKKIPKEQKVVKKVYQRPDIVSEEVFETLALACCKGNACRKFGFPRGLHGVS